MRIARQFGGPLQPAHINLYRQSPQWKDGRFHNLEETRLALQPHVLPRILYKQLSDRQARQPAVSLPVRRPEKHWWSSPADETHVAWYGHAAILLHMTGQTILIDPMFGPDASPIGPIRTRRFSADTLGVLDHIPAADLVLISHDHYDHLDLASIERLRGKVKHYLVALGVGRHLVRWGIPAEQITEFDWWDEHRAGDLKITFTPTRHFSGRGLRDRMRSLWGGWVIDSGTDSVWFSGDGGYGGHFREIGERLGPFDLGLMECGQYNRYWHDIHLFPGESVQAALDTGVKHAVPVHWGAFALSFEHAWHEPAEAFLAEAARNGLPASTPALGEWFVPGDTSHSPWWPSFVQAR